MDDSDLLRYSRQIMLPDFGYESQQQLAQASVLVVGMGGLGSPVAMYLAAAGVGHLVLNDFDRVDLSNLQRQIVHRAHALGKRKTESARATLLELNAGVRVSTLPRRLSEAELETAVAGVDVVVDATDNVATRMAVNRACLRQGRPLVFGAAVRSEGQLSVFNLRPGSSPCLQCLYPPDTPEEATCAANGVLAPVVGMIGTAQAMETLKLLTGYGECLDGRLLLLDAKRMEWRSLRLGRNPGCPACAETAELPC